MFSGRNDVRQEEKQVLINYCSVLCHHGLISSFYRPPLVNLHAEGRRDVAGSQLVRSMLPAGLQLCSASFAMGRRWIVRVMGPDAEDLRAFVGLFLLLPVYVMLGLEPSVSNLDILILAEHYLLPRSYINFCLGRELNQIAGGLQGWHGVHGVCWAARSRAASLLVWHELVTWFRHLQLDS